MPETPDVATSDPCPRRPAAPLTARSFFRLCIRECRNDDIAGIAAEVAYHLTFAIPPLLTLIVMIAAALNRFSSLPVEENLRTFINERAPVSLRHALTTTIDHAVTRVDGDQLSAGLLATTLLALWAGSNGVGALMKALNRAYGVTEARPLVRKKVVALGLTVLFATLANLSIALLVFGPQVGRLIARSINLGHQFAVIWALCRIPVALLLLMIMLAVMYRLAPNIEHTTHWLSPGAIAAISLWVALLFVFRFYLTLADPGSAYGVFSSLVVLLLFLYLSAIVILVGAEINAILEMRYDPEIIDFRADHPERVANPKARDDALRMIGTATPPAYAEASACSDIACPGSYSGAHDPSGRSPHRSALLAGLLGGVIGFLLASRARRDYRFE